MLTSLVSSSHLFLRKAFVCLESPNVDSAPGAPRASHPLGCEAAPQPARSRTRLVARPHTFLSPVILTSVDVPAAPPHPACPRAARVSLHTLLGSRCFSAPTAARSADPPPPAPAAPVVCCPPRGSRTGPTTGLGSPAEPSCPTAGDPQAPQARLRPSPRPLATTPPCSSLASRCPSVHPFGSGPWDALLMPRCTQLSSGSSQGSPQGGTSGCQLSARCPGVLVLLWLCTCRVLTVESLSQHDTFCADGGCARPPQRSPCAPPPRGRRTSPCCGRDVCDARCVAY